MSVTGEQNRNLEVVSGFVSAFNANDLEQIMSFFEEDAVYHNMPMAPVTGVDAIRGVIQGFTGMASKIEWIVRHQAATLDGAVLNERTDRFLMGEKWVELPVMGTFVIRNGKIAQWRDYFDMNQFQAQLPG